MSYNQAFKKYQKNPKLSFCKLRKDTSFTLLFRDSNKCVDATMNNVDEYELFY